MLLRGGKKRPQQWVGAVLGAEMKRLFAKVLLLTAEALWCHQKCCPPFSFFFLFHFTNAALLLCFLLLRLRRRRPQSTVSEQESHLPCTCDSALKQAKWNLNAKRPECILMHYCWFVTHIAVMCFCCSFFFFFWSAYVCQCMCVCGIHLHEGKKKEKTPFSHKTLLELVSSQFLIAT